MRTGANSGSESLIALYIAGDSFSRPYVHPARAALPKDSFTRVGQAEQPVFL